MAKYNAIRMGSSTQYYRDITMIELDADPVIAVAPADILDPTVTSSVPNPRKAHIAGGNAVLFRFSDPTERALASLGDYAAVSPAPSPTTEPEYSWPNKPTNGTVDLENVSLYVVNGLLNYYSEAALAVEAEAGINRLQASTVVFATNSEADRDALFLDRDCQVDDIVDISVGATTLRSTIIEIATDDDGEYTVLVLKDDLPLVIREAASVSLSLYISVDEVVVPWVKEEDSGEFNYTFDADGINIDNAITMFESSWTDSGVEQALALTEGELIVAYRAWVTDKINAVFTCDDEMDLNLIPGALHPANPLKWGIYAALQNSAGVGVKYTAVETPNSVASWGAMLDWLGDDTDIYGLVPMTHNQSVWTLYTNYITTQRANGHPLCVWVCPDVGTATLYNNLSAVVTEDADSDNYIVTAGSGQFLTDGIAVGDIVDFEFGEDAWGRITYNSGVVVTVYSEQSLLISTDAAVVSIGIPVDVTISRVLNAAGVTSALQSLAVATDNRYVRMVWPDTVTVNGYADREGYFVAAMLAGLRSGSYPHRSLSNVELTGLTSNERMSLLNITQRKLLGNSGVWVVNATPAGRIITRHGVTTSQSDEADYYEESVLSNIDGIEYDIRSVVDEYKGKSNVTKTILRYVSIAIRKQFLLLGAEPTVALGPRVFSGGLNSVYTSTSTPDTVALDTVVVNYTIVVPVPFHKLEIVQQIHVGLDFEVTE